MDVQAFVTPQTVIRARESTENTPANRRVREVGDRLAYLDPDAAPFTLLLQKGRKKSVSNAKFEWMEKELPARWDQVNMAADPDGAGPLTTGATAAATAIVVDNARYFSVGDIINVVRTGEKMRVSAIDTGTQTLTVNRAVGSTAAAPLADNDDLQIIGNAYAEGSPLGLEKSHIEDYLFNYTQIFRTPFGVTGTQDQSENYIGKDRPRLRAEKMIEHKIDLERTALFGERNIDTGSTNNPRRYTGGALYFLKDNIKDAGGVLTGNEIEDWLQDVYQHTSGGDSRTLLASPKIISVIDQLAIGNLQLVPSDKTYGIAVRQWLTAHGTFNIVKHRLLDSGLGGQGYGGYGLLVEPKQWFYRPLGNRDTKLRADVHVDGDDAWTDEYLTEVGWQVGLSKSQGVLKGVTG